MSRRDPEVPIRQLLAHAREVVALCRDKKRADLDADRLLNLAVTRLVEVIGEAAGRVPETFQEEHPELPWLQMTGARNRLIHGYDSVDFNILWKIVTDDLPRVISRVEAIIEEEFS